MAHAYSLSADETEVRRVRRHPMSLLPPLVSAAACVLAALALPVLGVAFAQTGVTLPTGVYGILTLILLAVGALVAIVGIHMYRNNYLVLTTQNIVIVEQHGLFFRHVSQSSLANVEDVRSASNGLLATVFGYGYVDIQTASEDQARFDYAPRPSELADQCLQAHVEFIKAHPDWR